MPDDIIASPIPPSPCPSSVSLRKQAWPQAICSDEEGVKDDANDTDDDFTVSIWQLWMDLIKEMNDTEEIHSYRYGTYY
ncbi:hypothetical protein PS15p_200571 [Mucor circinelloides]